LAEPSQNRTSEKEVLQRRAADAKFYLSLGSLSFVLLGIVLLLPVFFLSLPPNIAGSLVIGSLCYLIPGGALFIWGLGKVYRGKDLSFTLVRHAQFERKDLRKTAKFLLFVSFFAVLVILPVLIGVSLFDLMDAIIQLTMLLAGPFGLYMGVFLIAIFGNFTILFPIPYQAVLFLIALQPWFTLADGLLTALVAGLGATVGELTAWLLGRTQSEALEDSATGRRIMKMKEQAEHGYGGLLVFLYAATPLPDDILLMALGATKYPLWKTILACSLGKVVLCLSVVFGAQLPILRPVLVSMFGGGSDPIRETVYLVIGIVVILLIFFVPWGQYGRRLFRRKRRGEKLAQLE
jgi:membrane protein YqaA with SNARE-associated domain